MILAAVFKSSSAAELGRVLNTDELVRDIECSGTPATIVDGADEIVRRLAPVLRAGDVVAIMSNGGFDRIHDKLLDSLKTGK